MQKDKIEQLAPQTKIDPIKDNLSTENKKETKDIEPKSVKLESAKIKQQEAIDENTILATFNCLTKENLKTIKISEIGKDSNIILDEFVKKIHLNYNTNSFYPLQEQREIVITLGKMLKANRAVKLEIIGHTDSVGRRSYNKQLSLKRAKKIATCLNIFGINENRLDIVGYGEDKPLVLNTTKENMAKNRRVEFKLKNTGDLK